MEINFRWNIKGGIGDTQVSRMCFLTRLKCKKVRIDREKTSQMSIRRRLSERAVVKEKKLGWVCLQQRRLALNRT